MRFSSPLPSVRSRSNGIPHNSKIRFFFSSLPAWTLPAAWNAAPSTSAANNWWSWDGSDMFPQENVEPLSKLL